MNFRKKSIWEPDCAAKLLNYTIWDKGKSVLDTSYKDLINSIGFKQQNKTNSIL